MKDGIQTVYVEYVENLGESIGRGNFSELMTALQRNARAEGAKVLKVECEFKNPDLEEAWIKRYKPTKVGDKYVTVKEL